MDLPKLLKLLNENNVRYLIIGATAFPVHGYSRATLDTDIFIEPTKENAANTLKALKEFGYNTEDLSVDDLLTNKVLIRGYIVQSDFHPFVKGIKDFDSVWKNKIQSQIMGVPAYFTSLDDLILMKKAAGRAKDLEDLKYLEEIKKRKK